MSGKAAQGWLPEPTLRDQLQRAENTLAEAAAMLARIKARREGE